MLEEMSAGYLNDLACEDIWFTATENEKPTALANCFFFSNPNILPQSYSYP